MGQSASQLRYPFALGFPSLQTPSPSDFAARFDRILEGAYRSARLCPTELPACFIAEQEFIQPICYVPHVPSFLLHAGSYAAGN